MAIAIAQSIIFLNFKRKVSGELFIIFLTTTHLPIFFNSTPNYYNRKKRFEE